MEWTLRCAIPAFLLALTIPAGVAGEEPDLKSLDLEQLMNIRVTSVQRKEQSLARTASAVAIITRDDIRRAGVSTLPEALRLAPGLHVARAGSGSWAIGARGFSGQFANKLLVLIDGRSMYQPMNSGVFWDTLDLMLDDVERIEVIRGPGAVMWGANAVNGVINIITRRAEDSLGGFAEMGSGTEDRLLSRVRWGQRSKEGLAWRLSGQFAQRRGWSEAASAEERPKGPWSAGRLGFRMDWDRGNAERLEVHANILTSRYEDYYNLPFLAPGGTIRVLSRTVSDSGSVMARWTRPIFGGFTTLQYSYWRPVVSRISQLTGSVVAHDIDLQHRRRWGARHEFVLGAGLRDIGDSSKGSFTVSLSPEDARYYTAQFTVQDEWEAIRDRFFLSGGFRVEQASLSGANIQPTVRALWAIGPNQSLWGAVSRSVRTPSRWDLDAQVNLSAVAAPGGGALVRRRPSPSYVSEKQRSFELGYRQLRGRVSWDLAVFWSQYRDYNGLIPTGMGVDPLERTPYIYYDLGNLSRGRGYGAEAAAHLDVSRSWRLTGSFTHYGSRVEPHLPGATADVLASIAVAPDVFPRFRASLLSSYQLGRRWQANTVWYATGALRGQRRVGALHRLDANLQWRPSDWGGATFGVQNLTGRKLYEYDPEDGSTFDPIGRALFVRLQWWF